MCSFFGGYVLFSSDKIKFYIHSWNTAYLCYIFQGITFSQGIHCRVDYFSSCNSHSVGDTLRPWNHLYFIRLTPPPHLILPKPVFAVMASKLECSNSSTSIFIIYHYTSENTFLLSPSDFVISVDSWYNLLWFIFILVLTLSQILLVITSLNWILAPFGKPYSVLW